MYNKLAINTRKRKRSAYKDDPAYETESDPSDDSDNSYEVEPPRKQRK
jgi:hypothetical protein